MGIKAVGGKKKIDARGGANGQTQVCTNINEDGDREKRNRHTADGAAHVTTQFASVLDAVAKPRL